MEAGIWKTAEETAKYPDEALLSKFFQNIPAVPISPNLSKIFSELLRKFLQIFSEFFFRFFKN